MSALLDSPTINFLLGRINVEVYQGPILIVDDTPEQSADDDDDVQILEITMHVIPETLLQPRGTIYT